MLSAACASYLPSSTGRLMISMLIALVVLTLVLSVSGALWFGSSAPKLTTALVRSLQAIFPSTNHLKLEHHKRWCGPSGDPVTASQLKLGHQPRAGVGVFSDLQNVGVEPSGDLATILLRPRPAISIAQASDLGSLQPIPPTEISRCGHFGQR